jgi:hypothetical protein
VADPLISFLTTCMDREEFLAKTLRWNLGVLEASGIPGEIVVLDYGSKGGAHGLCLYEFGSWIDLGLLRPFRCEADYWVHGHAKNVVHRLSRGSILVDVDADVFLAPQTPADLKNSFPGGGVFAMVDWGAGSLSGFIACLREDFYGVRGYDEAMKYWSYNDYDMKARLAAAGLRPKKISGLRSIEHGKDLRLANLHPSMKSQEADEANVMYAQSGVSTRNVNASGWGAAVVWSGYDSEPLIYPAEPVDAILPA